MKFVNIFVALGFLFSAGLLSAENTVGKKLLMRPVEYGAPIGTVLTEKTKYKNPDIANVWIVFSDRENNPTFTDKNLQGTFKSMHFGDAFFVIDDEGNVLHLVKFDNSPGLYNTSDYSLKTNLEDYGWVAKDKMLLWNKCLVDTATKFSIKALSVNSVESYNNIAQFAKGHNLKLFNNPAILPANANDRDVRIFEFLYIYKEDPTNGSCLLGLKSDILRGEASRAGKLLIGWLSQQVIKKWSSRETLEINSDEAAVAERRTQNIKVCITKTRQEADQMKVTGHVPNEADLLDNSDNFSSERPEASSLRFPFFAGGDVIWTGFKTPVFNINGKEVLSAKQQDQMLVEYEKLKTETKNTNIIFVIDGSDVMKDYEPAIKRIIANTANRLAYLTELNMSDEGKEKVNYKMGAVVYRDYIEDECKTGNIVPFQIKKRTLNYKDIVDFFDNDVVFGRCKDVDNRQSVYMGISKATDLLSGCESQSNLIVVLGAGANKLNDKAATQDEVIKKLSKYNCPVFAFQVKCPSVKEHDAYNDFNTDFRKIILGEAQIKRAYLNAKFPENPIAGQVSLQCDDDIQNFCKLNMPKFSPIPGAIMFADELSPIEPDTLATLLLKMLEEYRTVNEKILDETETQMKGLGQRTDINEGTRNFFAKLNIDPKVLQKAAVTNIQLFVNGYTVLNCDKLSHPLYKHTVFVNSFEFAQLITDFRKIADGSKNTSDKRKDLLDVFKSLLEFRVGDKNVKARIKDTDIETLLASISGRSRDRNSQFAKYKIAELTETKKVSKEILDELTNNIMDKLVVLEEYYKDEKNSFPSNGERYYWVPDELLP